VRGEGVGVDPDHMQTVEHGRNNCQRDEMGLRMFSRLISQTKFKGSDMNWKSFLAGFGIAFIIAVPACGWLIFKIEQTPIKMGEKQFFDDGVTAPGNGYVEFSGTLGAGPSIFTGTCREIRKTCDTADVRQITPDRMGDLHMDTYNITKWTPESIEAASVPGFPRCVTIKLIIHRKSKLVEYIRSPRETMLDDDRCKLLEQRSIGVVIGDPAWAKKESR
jgi:hypothetical protein